MCGCIGGGLTQYIEQEMESVEYPVYLKTIESEKRIMSWRTGEEL
jgi:hypothetical protein